MLLLRKVTDGEISKDKVKLLLFISFSLEPAANWLKLNEITHMVFFQYADG